MEGRVLSVVFFQGVPLKTQADAEVKGELFNQYCLRFIQENALNGSLVKCVGTTLLLFFYSSTSAVSTSLQLKKFLAPLLGDFGTRIAIHTGEVVLLDGDIFGETVNTTSRLLDRCKIGQVLLSRSCVLSASRLPESVKRMESLQIRGLSNRIDVYELSPDREIGWRSKLQKIRIPEGAPQDIVPVKPEGRVTAGIIDLWAGFILMVLFNLATNLEQLDASLRDVVRVQAERMESATGSITKSGRASRSYLSPLSHGEILNLEQNESARTTFSGASGWYDVVAIFDFNLAIGSFATLTVGKNSIELLPIDRMASLVQTTVARSVYVPHGAAINLMNTSTIKSTLSIDAFDFIPVESAAYRPRAYEDSFAYAEIRRSINYDEMNVHFFLMPLPLFLFLHIFCGQLLLGRTLGCMARGIYIRKRRNERPPDILSSLARSLAWFLTPLTFWAYIGYQRKWSDVVTDTELVTVNKH